MDASVKLDKAPGPNSGLSLVSRPCGGADDVSHHSSRDSFEATHIRGKHKAAEQDKVRENE